MGDRVSVQWLFIYRVGEFKRVEGMQFIFETFFIVHCNLFQI